MHGLKSLNIIKKGLRTKRPSTRKALKDYIEVFLGVTIPDKVMTDGHSSPMDYIWHSFGADYRKPRPKNADCIVWANRGGGKTEVAGIITLLDCMFKPKLQTRILSGSEHQAGRLYKYFDEFLQKGFLRFIAEQKKTPTDNAVFKNGARVEVIKQSQKSVRGEHVHKLRCDEVELFNQQVFEAAQYTTMSTDGYIATLECISTMHKRYGLMKKLVKESGALKRPVFLWNVWDVVEKCKGRKCDDCQLYVYCEGKAKQGDGYYKIEDIITTMNRTKPNKFILEMLCGEGGKKKSAGYEVRVRLY